MGWSRREFTGDPPKKNVLETDPTLGNVHIIRKKKKKIDRSQNRQFGRDGCLMV